MKNCKHCCNQFEDKSRNKSALFCSKECKNIFWYQGNKDRAIANSIKYETNNVDKVRQTKRNYVKKRRHEDLNFRLASNLRVRLSRALSYGFKTTSLSEYLGCSLEDLKSYLESKFEPGMTWQNYGEWHIDHIEPLCKFDLTDQVQLKEACCYGNLQPLWKRDNLVKGGK